MTNVRIKLPKWNVPDPDVINRAVAATLYQIAEDVMTDSKVNYVPVDTGNLRASGLVNPPTLIEGRVTIEFGYGGPAAPYALAIHENPRAGITGGLSPSGAQYKSWSKVGGWKYLSTPFEASRRTMQARIVNAMVRARRKPLPA